MQTLADVIRNQSANRATISAPDRQPMTGAELVALTARVAGGLRASGIGQSDVVAIVMPNGPEMAAAFLAVAATAVTAPLNPAYRAEEFDFYLDDLKAKALIVAAGLDSPARASAHARCILVIDLTPDLAGPAGSFTLSVSGDETGLPAPAPSDVALVLHTSGTTSKPKQVPLTHANLVASAGNIARTLALTEADRIRLREDVYTGAWRRDGRPRFTAAHELGHWAMHTNIPLARARRGDGTPAFRLAEPQANQFAAEILMPKRFITLSDDENDLMGRFGVSWAAARHRLSYLQKNGRS